MNPNPTTPKNAAATPATPATATHAKRADVINAMKANPLGRVALALLHPKTNCRKTGVQS